ncbi:hypothetical protein QBC43DRAFT_288558 [Cladorrhinum sp. PSN259]|nr:hypothetical protein QBC43DRAFT_288558 [Cladorrhinum sp. PSN259]
MELDLDEGTLLLLIGLGFPLLALLYTMICEAWSRGRGGNRDRDWPWTGATWWNFWQSDSEEQRK